MTCIVVSGDIRLTCARHLLRNVKRDTDTCSADHEEDTSQFANLYNAVKRVRPLCVANDPTTIIRVRSSNLKIRNRQLDNRVCNDSSLIEKKKKRSILTTKSIAELSNRGGTYRNAPVTSICKSHLRRSIQRD